jgi:hypothetical protein
MQRLRTLANAATFSFMAGALCELSVTLVKRNEVVHREALYVYATTGGTAARTGATVPSVDPE